MSGRSLRDAENQMSAFRDDGRIPAGAPTSNEERPEKDHPTQVDLSALFDAHAPFLVRMVTRMVGSVDRAEDVVQRAFLTAHRKGLPPGDLDRARGWLYRVALNEVQHERRSLARRLRLARVFGADPEHARAVDEDGPERAVEAAGRAARVRALLQKLPERQREVFALYELEELS
ncbi:MAG: RNA polymerase sigma factor, partial [Myxococcota bacterium]